MSKIKLILIILITILLAAVVMWRSQSSKPKEEQIQNSTTATETKTGKTPSNKTGVFETNLEIPWALVFLPNGDLLVTERPARVRLIDKNGTLQKEPILELDDVKATGESGVHGITISPNFESNKFVYVYYTYDDQRTLNRVVRYKLESNKLIERQMVVDAIPGSHFHNGGRIKFGPDKFLYITTGDSLDPSLAQDTKSLAGKILRVTEDGKPAPGNPFGNEVYSYGHRNPQGIAWDTSGRLWETEHGPSTNDEINQIEIGKNYGWPEIQGNQQRNGMVTGKINSGSNTWAPAGAAFFQDHLFFAGLRGTALFKLNSNTLKLETLFKGEYGRIRDVVLGPDNLLYITTSNRDGRGQPKANDDKIIRLDPRNL